jgi:RecJ-like exonuclease
MKPAIHKCNTCKGTGKSKSQFAIDGKCNVCDGAGQWYEMTKCFINAAFTFFMYALDAVKDVEGYTLFGRS